MWLIDYFHYLMQQHQLQEYLHKKVFPFCYQDLLMKTKAFPGEIWYMKQTRVSAVLYKIVKKHWC